MIRHRFEHGLYVREREAHQAQPPAGALLYIHGLGESGLCFEPLLASPRLATWRQLTIDLPGYGKSPWRDARPGLEGDHRLGGLEGFEDRRARIDAGLERHVVDEARGLQLAAGRYEAELAQIEDRAADAKAVVGVLEHLDLQRARVDRMALGPEGLDPLQRVFTVRHRRSQFTSVP